MPDRSYHQLPPADRVRGNHALGEIEILGDESQALPVVFENKYVAVVEDRVRFPGGKEGRYMRIFHQSELKGFHGTVMVTRRGDRFVLLRLFRHTTRSWELEFPRGFAEPGLSEEENARKEVREELGVGVADITTLGVVCPNTGLLTTRARVFQVELERLPDEGGEDRETEAIHSFEILDRPTLLARVREGQIRCGFTLAAITLWLSRRES